MIQGVIFDMDGLMLDTETLAIPAWLKAGKTYGFPITEEQVAHTFGFSVQGMQEYFMSLFGDKFPFEKALQIRKDYVNEWIDEHGVPFKPGLLELLPFLKDNGYKIAVATSCDLERVTRYFHQGGIMDFFDAVVTGEMVPRSKPHPDIFLKACEELGLDPSVCLGLEDSPAGLESIFRAGMTAVMIPDKIPYSDKLKEFTGTVLSDLSEVITYLENENNTR